MIQSNTEAGEYELDLNSHINQIVLDLRKRLTHAFKFSCPKRKIDALNWVS